MDPINELPILVKRLSSFKNINCGGCGVIAVHVAKRLQHIVPTKVVVYNMYKDIKVDDIRSKVGNNRSVSEWRSHGMMFGHVLVEFEHEGKSYLFDSNGIQSISDTIKLESTELYKSGYLTIDEIASFASRPTTWNKWFDRNQIPNLRKRIDYFFKPYLSKLDLE